MKPPLRKPSILAVSSLILGLLGALLVTPAGSRVVGNKLGMTQYAEFLLAVCLAAVAAGVVALFRIKKVRPHLRGRFIAATGLGLGLLTAGLLVTVCGIRVRAVRHFQICGDNLKSIIEATGYAGRDAVYYTEPDRQLNLLLQHLPEGRLPVCPGGGKYIVDFQHGYGTKCSKHGDRASCSMGI